VLQVQPADAFRQREVDLVLQALSALAREAVLVAALKINECAVIG
jgi:hypothetical protein